MNIKAIRSDRIYYEMISASNEERENLYRYKLMKPFEFKWNCVGMPLHAEQVGGYDVVSASSMGGGYHPSQITEAHLSEIKQISQDSCGMRVKKVFVRHCKGLKIME